MAYTFIHKVQNRSGDFDIDADLDNIKINHIAPLTGTATVNIPDLPTITFDPINTNLNITNIPKITLEADTRSTVDVAIKEIPDTRAHIPSHYNLGITIFGVEVMNFSLCGESQVITEKYVPRRMEICR